MIGRKLQTEHDWPLLHYGAGVCLTLLAAIGVYRFFLAGDETYFVWYQLCCIPWALRWLANEFQLGVGEKLDGSLMFIVAAILCVGAFRTGHWTVILAAAGVLVVLAWLVLRHLFARDDAV